MLLAATEYVRPASLDDVLAALGSSAGARVLAGGQTLINVLKHRAAEVELLAAQRVIGEVAAGAVDRQVRARGTIGGNACFADPASNYPPLLVALGASMEIAGPHGSRSVPAADFFLGLWRTAVATGEVLVSVTLPPLDGAGVGYRSLALAADSWALARAVGWGRTPGGGRGQGGAGAGGGL